MCVQGNWGWVEAVQGGGARRRGFVGQLAQKLNTSQELVSLWCMATW